MNEAVFLHGMYLVEPKKHSQLKTFQGADELVIHSPQNILLQLTGPLLFGQYEHVYITVNDWATNPIDLFPQTFHLLINESI